MKFNIRNIADEEEITFSLVHSFFTERVALTASNTTGTKNLLFLTPEGRVIKCSDATIGSFKFDPEGKLIID